MRLKSEATAAFLSTGLALLMSCAQTRAPKDCASVPADSNDPCYMCHMLFTEEEISVAHLKAGIPCSRCHGRSLAHTSDETFSTPPDVVYSRESVNSFCRTCHPTHVNVVPEELVQVWIDRNLRRSKPEVVETAIVCTDCHGSHRISPRPQTVPGADVVK